MASTVDGLRFEPDPIECSRCPADGCDLTCVMVTPDLGSCPRCGRGGGMIDCGGGLLWCTDCNIGVSDDDDG